VKLFDLFARLPDGKPLWIESVENLALAEHHAARLLDMFRGECLVYSERDGLIVKRIDHSTLREVPGQPDEKAYQEVRT
jgi:hypothetical protein